MGFNIHGHFTLSFTENASDIIISDVEEPVYITLSVDNYSIIQNIKFIPDSKKQVTLLLRQLVHQIPKLAAPTSVSLKVPALTWTAEKSDESVSLGSYLMPGGIAKNIDTVQGRIDFFAQNFLTNQAQIIETTPEQPQWLAFVRPYPYRTMELFSTLYTADGRSYTKKICQTPDSYTFNQIDTSFSGLWSSFSIQKKLMPIAYDVYGMSVMTETLNGVTSLIDKPNHPIGQRYLLRPSRNNDHCFGFVNGMGGFDTLLMHGPVVLKPKGENETFINNKIEKELSNGYTSYWEASTGYIDSERAAAQYQDFLKSSNRWIYRSGEWLRIIVDEYKLEHTPRELNAYTFKYHLAEKNERRYFEREELREPMMPSSFFKE